MGQARGVEILAAINERLPIYEYTPLQIKQAVVGYGRAEKNQVQEMIKFLLNLKEIPKPDDVADALAVAICHGSCLKFKDIFNKCKRKKNNLCSCFFKWSSRARQNNSGQHNGQ